MRRSPSTQLPEKAPRTIIFDGECGFCQRAVERLKRLAGEHIEFLPFQAEEVFERFPALTAEECRQEMKLIEPDGTIYGGAEAFFRCLEDHAALRFVVWIYYVPGLRRVFDAAYRWIARRRACFFHNEEFARSFEQEGMWRVEGEQTRPTHGRVILWFWSGLGLIHLFAFGSLALQVTELVGSHGLLPLKRVVELGEAQLSFFERLWRWPMVFWIGAADWVLIVGVALGLVAAGLLVFRFRCRSSASLLFLFYLSYVTAGQIFFQFQWDNLLLETTFLSLLLPAATPLFHRRRRPRSVARDEPAPFVLFLFRWLLFRLYFESGLSKLEVSGGGWHDLSAMSSYYETAPLPTWIGYFVHQLPSWFHQMETLGTLLAELLLPVLIFSRRRFRLAAFWAFLGIQSMIIMTANYGFFNYLAVVLSLFLLDDQALRRIVTLIASPLRRLRPLRLAGKVESEKTESQQREKITSKRSRWRRGLLLLVASFLFVASLNELCILMLRFPAGGAHLRPFFAFRSIYGRFRVSSSYHLFANMTRDRKTIIIQGRWIGGEWRSYDFPFYPDDLKRAPQIMAPYHPRLDFQLWFLMLSNRPARQLYFVRLLSMICHDPLSASRYFAQNPFPDEPPDEIRLVLYDYRMSTLADWRKEGMYWSRELLEESPRVYQCATMPPIK